MIWQYRAYNRTEHELSNGNTSKCLHKFPFLNWIEKYKGTIANLPGYGRLHQPLSASSRFHAASGSIHRVFPASTKEVGNVDTKVGGTKKEAEFYQTNNRRWKEKRDANTDGGSMDRYIVCLQSLHFNEKGTWLRQENIFCTLETLERKKQMRVCGVVGT